MEQIIVNFWWTGDISGRKLHWLLAHELRKSISEGGLGFRSFYDFNLAFIAKIAWRVLTNPQALWVQLLKGLYFPRSDFLTATRHCKSSWIWSGIMEGRRALLQGLRKNIGDGQGTDITEAWIPEAVPGFTASFSHFPCSTKVSEFILHPQRLWNVGKLRQVFPEAVAQQILLIPLGLVGYSDRFVWHFEASASGKFSVRSSYHLLQANMNTLSHPLDNSLKKFWKWLWQLDLPQKN
ncbi:Uncharacterized mitochondrial protein AtMg00310 [Linum perenne]